MRLCPITGKYPCPEHTACPESFIGSIVDVEAEVMKFKIQEFKRRFDEDLAKRYKELFGDNLNQ